MNSKLQINVQKNMNNKLQINELSGWLSDLPKNLLAKSLEFVAYVRPTINCKISVKESIIVEIGDQTSIYQNRTILDRLLFNFFDAHTKSRNT